MKKLLFFLAFLPVFAYGQATKTTATFDHVRARASLRIGSGASIAATGIANVMPATPGTQLITAAGVYNWFTGTITFAGDVAGPYNNLQIGTAAVGANELASTTVTAGTYGSASLVPVVTVDADGRVTGVTTAAVSGGGGSVSVPSTRVPVGTGVGITNYPNLFFRTIDSTLTANRYRVPMDTAIYEKFSIALPRTAVQWRIRSGGSYGENGDNRRNDVVDFGFNLNRLDDPTKHSMRLGMENDYLPYPGAPERWSELHIPEHWSTVGGISRPGSWTGGNVSGLGVWSWRAESHNWFNSLGTQNIMNLSNGVFEVKSSTVATQEFKINNTSSAYGAFNMNLFGDGGMAFINSSPSAAAYTLFKPGVNMVIEATGSGVNNLIVKGKNVNNDVGISYLNVGTTGSRYIFRSENATDYHIAQMDCSKAGAINVFAMNSNGASGRSELQIGRDGGALAYFLSYNRATDDFSIKRNSTDQVYFKNSNGFVGIGTTSPSAKLTVSESTGYAQFNMATTYTPTSSADTNGTNGDVAYDANYIYMKVGGSWKRSALSTF